MPAAILGKKVGMTRVFTSEGKNVPVTIIEAGPCFVSQVKTVASDGYDAVQLAFDEVKPRNSTNPIIGHDTKAGIAAPQRFHREFRASAKDVAEVTAGQEVKVDVFEKVKFVDIVGTSKGKSFQGVMKRWSFKGMCASHGTERKHRSPGSIAARATNRGFSGRPKKGLRMPGHMGVDRVTVRSVEVIGFDKEKNLLLVKGPVPGAVSGMLAISEAKRLYKSKARLAKAS